MPQQPGFVFRVMIDGVAYKAKNVRVVDRATGQDVTNSEGVAGSLIGISAVGFGAKVPAPKDATVTVTTATFDDDDNPFGPAYQINAQIYLTDVWVYPISGGPLLWAFPCLLVTEVTYEAEVRGLQPVTFTAESDGAYTAPGEGG